MFTQLKRNFSYSKRSSCFTVGQTLLVHMTNNNSKNQNHKRVTEKLHKLELDLSLIPCWSSGLLSSRLCTVLLPVRKERRCHPAGSRSRSLQWKSGHVFRLPLKCNQVWRDSGTTALKTHRSAQPWSSTLHSSTWFGWRPGQVWRLYRQPAGA